MTTLGSPIRGSRRCEEDVGWKCNAVRCRNAYALCWFWKTTRGFTRRDEMSLILTWMMFSLLNFRCPTVNVLLWNAFDRMAQFYECQMWDQLRLLYPPMNTVHWLRPVVALYLPVWVSDIQKYAHHFIVLINIFYEKVGAIVRISTHQLKEMFDLLCVRVFVSLFGK